MRPVISVLAWVLLCVLPHAVHAAPPSVFVEDLTWTDVRDALRAGRTTIIIPVGGTEQNGPHMALGKHNVRARALAGRIATELGNALVAPVVAYVPEGSIIPPTGHMLFPGTISVPDAAFKGVLEGAARSFRQAGFRDIVLIGDSGNYQQQLAEVAARLNRQWMNTPARVHFITDYYRTAQVAFAQSLRSRGLSEHEIGTHAASADTSLTMAIDPSLVRAERLVQASERDSGVHGDPRAATAELGKPGVDLIVARSVAAIRAAVAAPRR